MNDLYQRTIAALADAAAFGADKPDETPESTARALWLAAAGAPRTPAGAAPSLPDLSEAQSRTLQALLARRIAGEPLAYLTGRQEFMGHEFLAAPGALIPRKETELLGRAAASLAHDRAEAAGRVRILDLCTGSGNLAVALALEEPRSIVHATDLTAGALALAARNIALHGVGNRVTLHQGDLFGALDEAVSQPFDLVVCNPPYIPSHKARSMPVEVGGFEPVAAFDGGDFGLSILLRLVAGAPRHLVPGGWLCVEVGAGQGGPIEKRLSGHGAYGEVRQVRDGAGATRALLARSREGP